MSNWWDDDASTGTTAKQSASWWDDDAPSVQQRPSNAGNIPLNPADRQVGRIYTDAGGRPRRWMGDSWEVGDAARETTVGEFARGVGVDLLQGLTRVPEGLADTIGWAFGGGESILTPEAKRDIQGSRDYLETFKPAAYRGEQSIPIVQRDAEGGIAGVGLPSAESVLGAITQSAPQIPMLVAGGGGLRAVAQQALPRSPRLAAAIGYGGANTALVAPAGAEEVRMKALANGATPEQADAAANRAFAMLAPLTAVTGGAGGALAAGQGQTGRSLARALAGGFLADAPFEGFEEGGQSVITDIALGRAVDVANALESAGQGVLAGGLPGAVIAGLETRSPSTAAPPAADWYSDDPVASQGPDAPVTVGLDPDADRAAGEFTPSQTHPAPPVDVPAAAAPEQATTAPVATVAAEPAPVPPVEAGQVRAPEPITPTEGRLEVDADTGRGQFRLVDEIAPDGTDYSEFGQVRRVTAYDGDTPVGTLVYGNDGLPPTVNVEPEYQRRGIATAMYELARQQGGILGDAQGGIRGRAEQYRTPAGMAFRAGADPSRVRLAPARPAAVESAGAPPPAATPQAEPAPASPPVTTPAAVRAEPASPAPSPEGVIQSDAAPAAPAVQTPPADAGGGAPAPTGTKNRITDAERKAEGRDPILKQMRRTHPETLDRAHQARRDNPRLVDEITSRTGDVHINDTEEAVLMLAKVDERNRRDEASKVIADPMASESERVAAEREWDDAEAAINRIDEANAARGTTWGRFGAFRQRMMASDYSLEAMKSKLRRAKGKGLDRAEDAALEALSAKLQAAETDLEAARAKLAEYEQTVIVRETIEQAVRAATAQMRGAKKAGKSAVEYWEARADAAMKRIKSAESVPSKRGQSGAVTNPVALLADVLDIGVYQVVKGASSLGDWIKAMKSALGDRFEVLRDQWPDLFAASRRAAVAAKPDAPTTAEVLATIDPANVTREDVRDLVMARIRAGEKDADAIMRAVTADVQTVAPDATEADVRQLFADYGKRASPTRDADKQTLRDLRTVVRLEKDIADAEAGLPRKTPVARQRASEEIRQLRARLSELLKQAVRRARTPEAEAALLAKRREVLAKQIADLGDQVETGRRPPSGAPRLTPEQLKDLTDQRDRLRNRVRWLDREAKKAAEAPAKAAAAAKQRENDRLNLIDGLNAQAERIQAQIDGGYREIPKSTQKVMDAGVAEARKRLAEVKEARKEIDRQTFADEIAAAKAEKRRADLSEQIADLEDMIATGRRPAKRERPDERQPELAARRDELQRELRRIDAAMLPRRSPDEVYQQRRGTSIAREIERVQARIAAGDYARSPRVPKALNEANKAAALKLEELRAEFRLKQFDYEMKNSGWMKRVGGYAAQALHLQRAIQTSYDLSGIGRQGVFSLFGHPIRTAKAIPEMLRAAGSRQERLASEEDIKSLKNAHLHKKYGLPINDSTLNRTEEVFTSRLLEKLRLKYKPGETGKNAVRLVVNAPLEITRGSERGYATVLNRLRTKAFDAFYDFMSEGGRPVTDRQGQLISDFVAATTGRSNVPAKVEGLANGLNLIYFAPRLVWSRFQVLYGHHIWLAALNGEWRAARYMAQEYARVAGAMALFYALAQAWYVGSGEEEEDEKKGDRRPFIDYDPRSSSFGQLRFGDHYINPTGGLSQAATFMARMMTGETVTDSGETVRLSDDPSRSLSNKLASLAPVFRKFGLDDLADAMPEQNTEKRSPMAADFGDVLARFNRTKLLPVDGAGWDWITGEDYMGQPTTTADILANMMLPMTIGTPWEAYKSETPAGKAAALTLSEIVGLGVTHRDRAALEAPDQATMSPDQRKAYNEYLRVSGNMKQDIQAVRDLANSFPADTSASDVRDAVQMKAQELGLDGIDVAQYARKTPERDERGIRKTGLIRTETGRVKMEYAKGSRTKLMMDTEEKVDKINAEMREFLLNDLTDEQINAKYREYVSGGDAEGNKELVIRQMRDQRDALIKDLMSYEN